MTTPATLHRVPRHPHAWLAWLLLSQLAVALMWWRLGWTWGLPALVLSHLAFVVPVFMPRARLYAPVLDRLPVDERAVWLTIDDGPSGDTAAILAALDRHRARATFFLVGERAQAHPGLVGEILRRGHGIGNHSQTHPSGRFWALGPRAMAGQVGQAQQALARLAGAPPRWFRSVVGHTNPFVAAVLRRHGLTRVGWSTRGYDGVARDPAAVLARIAPDLRSGAIVLLHEGGSPGQAVAVLEGVLQLLQQRGLRADIPG